MAQPTSILTRQPETIESFPGLAAIADRACDAMQDLLARLGCQSPSVTLADAELLSAKMWQARLGASAVRAFAMSPYKGNVIASFDAELIVRLVDIFYGGTGDAEVPQRHFGSADLRLITRMGDLLVEALPSVWQDIAEVAPEALQADSASKTLHERSSEIIVHSYKVEGVGASPVQICWAYPVGLLRQIPALRPGDFPDATPAYDQNWHGRLNRAVMEVSLPLRTIFARPEVPLSRLLVLKPGDIIPVCLPSTVPVTIAGRVFAEGTVGESGGRTAIRISRIAEGCLVDD